MTSVSAWILVLQPPRERPIARSERPPFSTKGTTLRLDGAAVDRGAARDGSSINQTIQQLEPETLAATSD